MKRRILAICDLEVAYACQFMEHMNRRKNLPFEVQAFTSLDNLKMFVQKTPVEILLVSERALNGREDEVEQWDIGQVIVLNEGMKLAEKVVYPTVSKYQSSDSVIREVMAVYAAKSKVKRESSVMKKDAKIIGIYSPVGRCLKTSLALTMGQILARDRVCLYLNLESYAGFEELFHVNYNRTLSDVIYYLRKENDNMIHRINGIVQTMEHLDYIPPVPFPQDVSSVTAKEWAHLLEILRYESTYEIILLDIGEGIENLYDLLEQCDIILTPVKSDVISTAKLAQFEKMLKLWNGQNILERIRRIKLPYYTIQEGKGSFLKQLLWSELGDFVRNLIWKEKLC